MKTFGEHALRDCSLRPRNDAFGGNSHNMSIEELINEYKNIEQKELLEAYDALSRIKDIIDKVEGLKSYRGVVRNG